MNTQENKYFELLHKDREESARTLEKPSMRGIKKSVVDKYSDQAHFIYELLQNADDARATSARFVLEPSRLIFAHNGTRRFSISNPETEEADAETGMLGDINAITSIANSNKIESSIGKFGVGFKAVFQYTTTPHIYDQNYKFKIDRFIVPTLLDDDFEGRKPNETLFVFPFDHPEINQEEAYDDIANKLRRLSHPILFLSNLKNVEFEFGESLGLYGKNITETRKFDDAIAEKITLVQNENENLYEKQLWLFSREDSSKRKFSVGFLMDENGELQPANEPAFCFFPTRETTQLKFIIHAPFLLTDSREGIKARDKYNNEMIAHLATLAADSLVYLREIGKSTNKRLITDTIVNIVPTDELCFSDPANKDKISFKPFFEEIKNKLLTEEILPTRDGYVSHNNAYWAEAPYLTNLFSDEQLVEITGNPMAKWVFVSLGRSETNRNGQSELCRYIDEITRTHLSDETIICGRSVDWFQARNVKGITAQFVERQPLEWLQKFYKWISDTKKRAELIRQKPVFIDQDFKAVSAFDNDGRATLFLPIENVSGYRFINDQLLKCDGIGELVRRFEIKEPSLKDYIYVVLLPKYEKEKEALADISNFKVLFEYFCKCSSEDQKSFIEKIRDYKFVLYRSKETKDEIFCGSAAEMYFPTPELEALLENTKFVRFVAIDKYIDAVGKENEKALKYFLLQLGVSNKAKKYSKSIDPQSRRDLPAKRSRHYNEWSEPIVEGVNETIEAIVQNKDINKSILIWNTLLSVAETYTTSWKSLSRVLSGEYEYFYYSYRIERFTSSMVLKLQNEPWMLNADLEFVKPSELSRPEISSLYNINSQFAEQVVELLQLGRDLLVETIEEENDDNLTDKQREEIELGRACKEYGMTKEDIPGYLAWKNREQEKQNIYEINDFEEAQQSQDENSCESWMSQRNIKQEKSRSNNSSTRAVVQEIYSRVLNEKHSEESLIDEGEEWDADEYLPKSIDFTRKAERAKDRSALEIRKIEYQEELQQKAVQSSKYSFGWFKSLLELEALFKEVDTANSKEISISFAKVEREEGTQHTIILKQPNKYIPQFVEDFADIPLVLQFQNTTRKLIIEVINVKSYTLRVKLKAQEDLSGIDFSKVIEARIDAKSPVFLLEELRKKFLLLGQDRGFDDDFDMMKNLCSNIEFVFGPPGTGKTTHLAQRVILPIMRGVEDKKILVLTPTNKAADVLARKIVDTMDDKNSYEDWLVRFGGTGDELLEEKQIVKDKTFDIKKLKRNVTITTIARFPYDFFMINGERLFLDEMKWDYIIIDEASMIPLINIIYPLYKKTPHKFVIAGDPFQIEPITAIDLWKEENIYTMVGLSSFVNPQTHPHNYKVTLLTTQYRSIPSVGQVFSRLTYGGILKHKRKESDRRNLNLGEEFVINPLNIIKYPVSKYESIYRAKRLNKSSSYQIYSALFTYEYVIRLANAIANANPQETFSIGIISPYKTQADLIEKLIGSEKMPSNIIVQVGTIHGFQGDECDIVFAVLNAPPTITGRKDMFLNKRNIINVSISRARDYLFVVIPDDDTENVDDLKMVKRVEKLMKAEQCCNEMSSTMLELKLFGSATYLEENAFSTGHQNVNVYGLPEKKYEIRSEDTAVDIQIHKEINDQ